MYKLFIYIMNLHSVLSNQIPRTSALITSYDN